MYIICNSYIIFLKRAEYESGGVWICGAYVGERCANTNYGIVKVDVSSKRTRWVRDLLDPTKTWRSSCGQNYRTSYKKFLKDGIEAAEKASPPATRTTKFGMATRMQPKHDIHINKKVVLNAKCR